MHVCMDIYIYMYILKLYRASLSDVVARALGRADTSWGGVEGSFWFVFLLGAVSCISSGYSVP